MDILYYAVAVLVFIAVALATEAGWQWWFSTQSDAARRLSRRIKEVHTRESVKQRDTTGILKDNRLSQSASMDVLLRRLPGMLRLQIFLQQSGIGWSVAELLSFSALSFLVAYIVAAACVTDADAREHWDTSRLASRTVSATPTQPATESAGAATARGCRSDQPQLACRPCLALDVADVGG